MTSDNEQCVVRKTDLASVLTVYEAHTPPEVRAYCPWYLACVDALSQDQAHVPESWLP